MSYRKFKADYLFTGTRMEGGNKVLVTTTDGRIEAVIDVTDAGEFESFNGIICPGFVNTHCHLELSHMKGLISEGTGLVDFVYKVVNERHFAEEEIVSAIEKAEDEMMTNGIVAVGDICNNLFTLPQKQKQRLAYYNFIEASGWLPSVSQTRFDRARDIYTTFRTQSPQPGIHNSIVPHAPYSVSADLWQLLIPLFEKNTVSIHNQETPFEDAFFREGTGDLVRMYELMKIDNTFHQPTKRSSLQSYFSHLAKAGSILLVHNTFSRVEDIVFAQDNTNDGQQLYFCVCINANRYIENSNPPVELLRANDCQIVLGTDSLASNRSLSILDEIKTIQKEFPLIPLEESLRWATLNGAKALQMDEFLGSFENGKMPGVLLIENVGVKLNDTTTVKRIL
jgi:cytosine/adenosine deaminase-related metal-dependent hydrolase